MNVVMPQLGETVAEGTIAAWHVKVGDRVEVDDLLLDIETDKVATEIPAPLAGTIDEILVAEGETVVVGTVLAVIRPDAVAVDPDDAIPDSDTQSPLPVAENLTPLVQPSAYPAPLSPAVRRLFAQHSLNPFMVSGTGAERRIKRSDVLEYLRNQTAEPEQAAALTTTTGEMPGEDTTFVPFNLVRRMTALHMVRSKAVSPHVLQAMEVDFTNVAKVRAKHSESWREKTGYSLTFLPFIARAVCLAIGDFPHINASVADGGLRLHPHVHLAIAVDLGREGLVAPVIKTAESLSVARFADRIHALTMKARAGSLSNADLSGGTYTLSNSGAFGTLITAPIINQPQVAILSIDAISKRPVVVGGPQGDSIAIRSIGILAQSFDHRAMDGAYAAAFLRRVKAIIEESDWLRKLI